MGDFSTAPTELLKMHGARERSLAAAFTSYNSSCFDDVY